MQNFIFKKVYLSDNDLMYKIYKLRFQVYCKECGFIKEEDYHDQIEFDEYDAKQAVHFAALNEDGELVGTMRMILPGDLPLPIEKHCPDVKIDKYAFEAGRAMEISRLVISKHLRRRKDDGRYYGPQVRDKEGTGKDGNQFVRRVRPMAFGLYREVYRECKRRGITHWYALMEKGLWLLLRIHGFNFERIGDEVDVYGPVCPYLGRTEVFEKEIKEKFPDFFNYFTEPDVSFCN